MERLQAYKFQLRPAAGQESLMRRFAGCCRFLWNKALALEKEYYKTQNKRLGYYNLAGLLRDWKKEKDTSFLAEANAQILQQSLKDLDRAYTNFFAKRTAFPCFKKKGLHDSFRYPQRFKIDEDNSRVYLPKIGWVRYRKGRNITGIAKQATVSLSAGKWYVSIQTEQEVSVPKHPSQSALGIDLGIARFATFSDGTSIKPLNSFRKHEKKLAALQHKFAKRIKFSANWQKMKKHIQRLHCKIADIRRDFLHKLTTTISKNHALVVMEDLKVQSMSRSASGTVNAPGKNVQVKSRLNKSILDQGWYEFRRQLAYKMAWSGGKLLIIPPQYTSQKCSHCGYMDKKNRQSQAIFKCMSCGFICNADHNAAINILAAGQAVSACGVDQPSMLKQEPAYDVAQTA